MHRHPLLALVAVAALVLPSLSGCQPSNMPAPKAAPVSKAAAS